MANPLESTLERHRAGDPQAVEILMEFVERKVAAKVATLLPTYPCVARWDRPSDIRQDAAIKLLDSLTAVKPESVRHLLNLAALQVKRVLVDKVREHSRGGRGLGNLEDVALWPDDRHPADEACCPMTGPGTLDQWQRFHACVDSLPELDREVFSMRWYLEEDEETIAKALGVSRSTVQRAYSRAKKVIQEKLGRPTRD
jgi:RNA polymerase sigma factor (sigma-70 family)